MAGKLLKGLRRMGIHAQNLLMHGSGYSIKVRWKLKRFSTPSWVAALHCGRLRTWGARQLELKLRRSIAR